MPKVGMELGITTKVGDNWIKATVNVVEIDTDISVSDQLSLTKRCIDDVYDMVIEKLEEKIMSQIDSGEKMKRKKV